MKPQIPKLSKMKMVINLDLIAEFNRDTASHYWGSYKDPFDAGQFVKLYSEENGQFIQLGEIPTFSPASQIIVSIEPNSENYFFEIDHIRMQLIGRPTDYVEFSPRELWSGILDLQESCGAIGEAGDFFLGPSTDVLTRTFKLTTRPKFTDRYNIVYIVVFSIRMNNVLRYCLIDPLIKTSSEET
jgi:hypothetical protein